MAKDFDGVRRMTDEPTKRLPRWPTGIAQANFGQGGLVPASVSLLQGDPGSGTSTLSLPIAVAIAKHAKRPALIVSFAETFENVKRRAERVVPGDISNLLVMGSDDLQEGHGLKPKLLDRWNPSIVVVNALRVGTVRGARAKDRAAVRDAALVMLEFANADSAKAERPWLVIGHGDVEYADAADLIRHCDTALHMTMANEIQTLGGDVLYSPNREAFRILSTRRNRFGRADVESYFTMTETGLVPYDIHETKG